MTTPASVPPSHRTIAATSAAVRSPQRGPAAAAGGHVVALVVASLAALAGCRGGGDLVSNPHRISDQAAFVAQHQAAAPPLPRELQKVPLPRVFVQPGDGLLLEPTRPDFAPLIAPDQTIAADGTIDLGEYGRPVVVGLPVEEIEQVIAKVTYRAEPELARIPEDLLEDGEAEEIARRRRAIAIGPINVRLIAPESLLFYVLGEVSAPGAYRLDGRETVLDGLLEAGGLTDRSDRCQIIIARPTGPYECRVVMRVCYDRLVQLGDTTTNFQLLPGDRIYVASKTFCDTVEDTLCFWKPSGCDLCRNTGSCPCPCPETAGHLHPSFPTPPVLGSPLTLNQLPVHLPELLPDPDDSTPPRGDAAEDGGDATNDEADDEAGSEAASRGPAANPPAAAPAKRPGPGTMLPAPATTIERPTLDLPPPKRQPIALPEIALPAAGE